MLEELMIVTEAGLCPVVDYVRDNDMVYISAQVQAECHKWRGLEITLGCLVGYIITPDGEFPFTSTCDTDNDRLAAWIHDGSHWRMRSFDRDKIIDDFMREDGGILPMDEMFG